PARGDARHRRANPEFARLVTRGANDAALGGRASDNHRFAAKRRAIALFDGCIKSVHIKMKYHPAHNLETDASIWGILSFSLKSALLLTWRVNEGYLTRSGPPDLDHLLLLRFFAFCFQGVPPGFGA